MSSENDDLAPTNTAQASNEVTPTFDEKSKLPVPEQEPIEYEHDGRSMVEKENMQPALTPDGTQEKDNAHRITYSESLANERDDVGQENQAIKERLDALDKKDPFKKADLEKEWGDRLGRDQDKGRDRS